DGPHLILAVLLGQPPRLAHQVQVEAGGLRLPVQRPPVGAEGPAAFAGPGLTRETVQAAPALAPEGEEVRGRLVGLLPGDGGLVVWLGRGLLSCHRRVPGW